MSNVENSVESWSQEDREEFRKLFGNKVLVRAFKEVMNEAQEMNKLSSVDLSSEEGMNEARERKGAVRGMTRAIELLTELATRDEGVKDAP